GKGAPAPCPPSFGSIRVNGGQASFAERRAGSGKVGAEPQGEFEMRRAVLICAMLALLSPTCAAASERIWRVGVLALAHASLVRSVMLPYLATRGFVEGRNLTVDVRVGTEEQLPELAQALVGDKP